MINPYTYIPNNDELNCNLKEENSLWFQYSVEFPSAQTVKNFGNIRVKGDYCFPRKAQSAPLAILVHGMGDSSVVPCKLIAHTLAKKGIASFILYLVFHKCRVTPAIQRKYPNLSDEEWFESYQISVTDVRQVIDWAYKQTEIKRDQIAVIGVSYGGFISSIAMALDKRIKAGVIAVSGGNSDKITKYSLLLRHQYKHDESEFRVNQEAYTQYIKKVEENGIENVIAGKNSFLTDPMTFYGYMRNRPFMMLNALWDEMIPKVATLDLWNSYGKPTIIWYPATHATIWLWYPWIGPKIYSFLNSVFD